MLRQVIRTLVPRTMETAAEDLSSADSGSGIPSHLGTAEQVTIWVIYIIYLAVFALKPQIGGYGRALIALLAASLIVLIQDLTPGDRQNLIEDVDYDIIVYLFGLMIISHYMTLTGLIRVPNAFFHWTLKRFGPYALLWALSLVTGLIAIVFTNDMAVFLMTPIVVRLTTAREYAKALDGSVFIFLMAMGTNANIASSMSPIGNPQNVLVASRSGLSFGTFMKYLSIGATVCWILNTALLSAWFYWLQRKRRNGPQAQLGMDTHAYASLQESTDVELDEEEGAQMEEKRNELTDAASSAYNLRPEPPVKALHPTVLNILTIASASIFFLWIVIVTVFKVYLGWATVLAALLVMTIHSLAHYFCKIPRQEDPEVMIFRNPEVVDYALLFMFHANFVLIGALLDTGWPQFVFQKLLGSVGDQLVELWLVVVFVYAVVFASNILTNVPVILLLEPLIVGLPDPTIGWLLIAFSTTIAGNLTLVGSAANLIVDARSRAIGGPELTFMKYFYYGFPSTIVLSFVGMVIISLNYRI